MAKGDIEADGAVFISNGKEPYFNDNLRIDEDGNVYIKGSEIDSTYLKLNGSNDPITGDVDFNDNIKITMGSSGATDYKQYFDGTNQQYYTSGKFVYTNNGNKTAEIKYWAPALAGELSLFGSYPKIIAYNSSDVAKSSLAFDTNNGHIIYGYTGLFQYVPNVAGAGSPVSVIDSHGLMASGTSTTRSAQLSLYNYYTGNPVILARGASGQTGNLQEWQNYSGTVLTKINKDGNIYIPQDNIKYYCGAGNDASIYYDGTDMIINSDDVGSGGCKINALNIRADGTIQPISMADAAAANDSIYYSTTAGKLVYKDSGGVVNNLY